MFFFDIDGTLVNDRKSVLKPLRDAITIVKEQGVLVEQRQDEGRFCQGIDGRLDLGTLR